VANNTPSRGEAMRKAHVRMGVTGDLTLMAAMVAMFVVAAKSPVWLSALAVLTVVFLGVKTWSYAKVAAGIDQRHESTTE
jgi:hypothetical protein